jgi:hypothetical protein
MRRTGRTGLVVAAVALAAVPAIAGAAPSSGPPRDKATGGGQAFFDSREPTGAGDTVAFTAQRARDAAGDSSDATGQVQVNRRGDNAVKFHGIVDCLVVNASDPDSGDPVVSKGQGEAYISGYVRGDQSKRFELYVKDGGKGQMERVNDMIALFAPGETDQGDPGSSDDNAGPCGFAEAPTDVDVTMARGNVQVTNANTGEDQAAAAPQQQVGVESLSAPLTSLLS